MTGTEDQVMNTVKLTVRLEVPSEAAFRVFTQKMGAWWPADHHIGKEPFAEVVVESRAGGRWFERDSKGAECDWGRVAAWEPPRRLVLAWHLQADFTFSPDPSRASEVVLDFIPEGAYATRVELEHRHLERHGEDSSVFAKRLGSPGGWPAVLDAFVASVQK